MLPSPVTFLLLRPQGLNHLLIPHQRQFTKREWRVWRALLVTVNIYAVEGSLDRAEFIRIRHLLL